MSAFGKNGENGITLCTFYKIKYLIDKNKIKDLKKIKEKT